MWVSFPINAVQRENNAKNPSKTLSAVYEDYYGPVPEKRNFFIVSGSIEKDDEPVVVPAIQINFRK